MSAGISVLVLNYNGKRFLEPCFKSILADATGDVEVVLVDNGSTDGSAELVRVLFPAVRVIRHEQNLGFARGYNEAVKQTNAGILVLLNNDTVVKPGWLKGLVAPLLAEGNTTITTSKVLFMGTDMVNGAGGMMTLWMGCRERLLGLPADDPQVNAVAHPFFAFGASMAIKREVFDQLNGFDEQMFAYGEDLDISWRARLAGYEITYTPESEVFHHFSGTWGVVNPTKLRMVTRHHLRVMIKCLSWTNLLHAIPVSALVALGKGWLLTASRRNLRLIAAVITGELDVIQQCWHWRRLRQPAQVLRRVTDKQVFAGERCRLVFSWDELRATAGLLKRKGTQP
jgi:hypothetical protein